MRRLSAAVLALFIPLAAWAGEPAPIPEAAILKSLCPSTNCKIDELKNAGLDDQKRQMALVGLSPTKPPNTREPGREPCIPADYWLIRHQGGQILQKEFIITLRADGECEYGVAGGWEEVELSDNELRYSMFGGSAWGWSETKYWRLSPRLQRIAESSEGFWKLACNRESVVRDLEQGLARVAWHAPVCGANQEPPEGDDQDCGKVKEYRYDLIPRLAPGDPFLKEDWKNFKRKPNMWLRVDSSGKAGLKQGGFVATGKKGAPEDAGFWVAADPQGRLYIEITDDRLTSTSPNWINEDHLEIWTVNPMPSYGDHCLSQRSRSSTLTQWGIRIKDGKVFAGYGSPQKPVIVETGETSGRNGAHRARFRLTLPAAAEGISVVYSDSDDGLVQKRLIATSQIRFGDAASLGKIAKPDPVP